MTVGKGDPQRLGVRCRLVLQVTKKQNTTAIGDIGAVFAVASSFECWRLDCSWVMISAVGQNYVVWYLDLEGTRSPRDHEEGVCPIA